MLPPQPRQMLARLAVLATVSTAVVYALFWLEVRDPRMLQPLPVLRTLGAIALLMSVIVALVLALRRFVGSDAQRSLLAIIVIAAASAYAKARLPIAEVVLGDFAVGVQGANTLLLAPIACLGVLMIVALGHARPLTDAELEATLAQLEKEAPPIRVADGLADGTRVVIYDPDCAACDALLEQLRTRDKDRPLLHASVHSRFAAGVFARHPTLGDPQTPVLVDRDEIFGECTAAGWHAASALDAETSGRPRRWRRELSVLLPTAVLDWATARIGGHRHASPGRSVRPSTLAQYSGRVLD
jgi:predicted DCC family thiol-disulfide oxidoreductase YuxK/flagellar biogenesis protein FliO